jgi:hypothetical protein
VLFIRGMLISKVPIERQGINGFYESREAQGTSPWRQSPVRDYAGRCAISDLAAPSLDHVFGHRPLRDLNAELKQLAVDTGRAA